LEGSPTPRVRQQLCGSGSQAAALLSRQMRHPELEPKPVCGLGNRWFLTTGRRLMDISWTGKREFLMDQIHSSRDMNELTRHGSAPAWHRPRRHQWITASRGWIRIAQSQTVLNSSLLLRVCQFYSLAKASMRAATLKRRYQRGDEQTVDVVGGLWDDTEGRVRPAGWTVGLRASARQGPGTRPCPVLHFLTVLESINSAFQLLTEVFRHCCS